MLYIQTEEARRGYMNACRAYGDLIGEREKFNGKRAQQLENRIHEARFIMNERKNLYESLLEQLRRSKDVCDMVYRYRYLDRLKVFRIAMNVGYSEAQVYRILKKIRANANMIENESLHVI
ncbi:MAG: hypothetical protein J5563_00410 [Clostridia bacterium]|nr:hypothetical protein [Clostridia bacterium]